MRILPLLMLVLVMPLTNKADPTPKVGDHHSANGEFYLLNVLDFQRRLLGMLTVDEETAAYARGERPSLDGRMRPRTVQELSAHPDRYPLWNAINK